MVDLVGRAAVERHVRAMAVVPAGKSLEFLSHLFASHGDQDDARAERFHREDEPLDDGDAAVLADGAEARLDLASLAPVFEAADTRTGGLCRR